MSTNPNSLNAPALTKKPISRLVWIGGALAAVVLACLMCAGVGVGGWWLGSQRTPAAKKGGKDNVEAFVGVKNVADWNFQDIQDRLAAKGVKSLRRKSGQGMFFEIGDDSGFIVFDLGAVSAAKKEAARIKDVEQREVVAWERFVFEEVLGPRCLS